MKVTIIGPVYPYRGGIAHHSAGLAQTLEKNGHEVEVINFRTFYLRILFPGKTMMDTSGAALCAPQRRLLRPLAPWTWFAAARQLSSSRAEAVVVQWWHVFFAPCLLSIIYLAQRRGLPVTVICHNVSDHDRPGGLNSFANRLLARLNSSIVVHSAVDADRFIRRFGPANVTILPLPPFDFFTTDRVAQDEARDKLGIGPGPLCLFFGLVRPYKGLADLLQALWLLRQDTDPPHLLIAGEFYESVAHYRALIRELGLDDRVTLIDQYVPNEEVALYFSAADVLIAPYRTASQSGVVSIALSLDVPAIVSDAGGLPEMIEEGKTGLIVPANSTEELSAAIRRFFAEKPADGFILQQQNQCGNRAWPALVEHIEATVRATATESGPQ